MSKKCKYCGGKIGTRAHGAHGLYCSRACYDAVNSFLMRLNNEYQRGKSSLDAIPHWAGVDSDGGESAQAMYRELDRHQVLQAATDVVGSMMFAASDIHPLLPSALILLARGMTQTDAAATVGLDRANLATYTKQLRTTCSGADT